MMTDKIKMAMVSTGVRRDTLAPIRHFTKFEIVHFYDSTPYFDLYPEELSGLVRYKNFFDLCQKLKENHPEVIQGSEPYGFPRTLQACVASYLMSRTLNAPLFFPMLENSPPESRFGFLSPALKRYLKIYASQCFTILCLNNGVIKSLREIGVSDDKLIRCNWGTWGVETDEFTPGRDKNDPDFGRAILFVGRLDEAKGVPYLLQAFKEVKKSATDVKLVMIGNGPLHDEIKAFSRANSFEKDIILLGTVKNRDLPKYFRAALITVAPSVTMSKWQEQIGMVNIQSMSCATPVVSTFSGAIPEYVKHDETGLLVRERDSTSLAEAMAKLLKDEDLRKRFGANARKHAVENLDAKKNIVANEKLLLDLLNKKPVSETSIT